MQTTAAFLLGLVTAAMASPTAIRREDSPVEVPDDVPAPGDGRCALVTIAGVEMVPGPGGVVGNNNGFITGAIDGDKNWLAAPESLDRNSPGFSKTLKWDSNTLEMSANTISVGEDDWNIEYTYNGKDYTCDGHKCNHYDSNEFFPFDQVTSWHVGEFDC